MGKPAEIKTKPTASSVTDFIESLADKQKRKDSYVILALMEKATKEKPKMWGSSIVGFGKPHISREQGGMLLLRCIYTMQSSL